MRSKRRVGMLFGGMVLCGWSASAALQEPSFSVMAAALFARSQERAQDQAGNPEYLERMAPLATELALFSFPLWPSDTAQQFREEPRRRSDIDPFRAHWGCTEADAPVDCVARGRELDVSITNRYGARMHAHLSLPASDARAPFPAVLFVSGGELGEHAYRGIAQGLAEAGYVVLALGVQGDYGSQQHAPDPDPSTPANEYCRDGGNWNNWQGVGDLGIQEQGACAGESFPPPAPGEPLEPYYEKVKARKVFGALDAADWLLSDLNPARALINEDRLAIVGHSLGAHAALLVGNADPWRRFDAVVAMDGYGPLAPTAAPGVPTMYIYADGHQGGPHAVPPDPLSLPGHRESTDFEGAMVPVMTVVLGGSTHQEFLYIPLPFSAVPPLNASRDGERVGLYYTTAWLDRWLKRGSQNRESARQRLLARVYDDSGDRSSIGVGRYDAPTGRNVPPTIGGETATFHLSPLYRSIAIFDGVRCSDLRGGCD